MTSYTYTRGHYDQINISSLSPQLAGAVRDLVAKAADAAKIDEHGNWDFGRQFDGKGRGSALNWDLYGIGEDVHDGGLLIIVQIRQFTRRRKNGFGNVRKNYFLLGGNEDGSIFAHPVSANVVRSAINRGVDVVLACQNWIFGGDYAAMLRHGDLAMIPMMSRPAGTKGQLRKVAVLEDSHRLEAAQIATVDGRIYAKSPRLRHLPGVHPDVEAPDGWYRIVVGKRAKFWEFAVPTID